MKLDQLRWTAFPLGLFVATRVALIGLAAAGTVIGRPEGSDPNLRLGFARSFATLSATASGDAGIYARIAREGYRTPQDAGFFPFLVGVGKLAAALGGIMEFWIIAASLVAGAAAFVVVYRFYERVAGPEVARWGLALMAAFPFAFHLSDGSALSLAVLFSALAALHARNAPIRAGLLASVGALAHPAALAVVPLIAWPMASPVASSAKVRLLAAALPLVTCAAWLAHLNLPAVSLRANPLAAPPATLAASLIFVAVVGLGCLQLLLTRAPAGITCAACLQFALLVALGGAPAGRALAACWLAFLPLGRFVDKRVALAAPAVALLAVYQGLIFYLFSHQYGFL